MSTIKTPGFYIVEKSTFPNSVVEVSTAVPAFIGHTERAISGNQSLLNKPWKITSMAEFQTYFGGPSQDLGKYLLYYSMMLFYANGGGSCYIVSVGDFKTEITSERLISGIEELVCEHEPTLLVIPETTLLPDVVSSAKVHMAMLSHCGFKMKNRIAILDIYEGYKERNDPSGDKVLEFRESIGDKYLDFGVAYYPWINTTIIMPQDLNGLEELNLMPPGSAMAGIYTMIDNTRGVWKAPANVKINRVLSPSVNITNQDQEDLNVPLNGKSINAIRFFTGEGTIVWGARTLDGNSHDWRYINVRRTIIMLEESIKASCRAYVFEPNVADTWAKIKVMITNFLTGVWRRGGLVGASPEDAFRVQVGLGESMTDKDILEGVLRIKLLVAIMRPGEFLEITFHQQMQRS